MTSENDVRPRTAWGVGTWVLLGLAVLAEVAATVMVDWFVQFGQSSTCGEPPTPSDVHTGQLVLFVVLGVAALPWLLAAWSLGDLRSRLLVAGAVACVPAGLFALAGLSNGFWVSNFCF